MKDINISEWKNRLLSENLDKPKDKKEDEFLKAQDNLYKKVTGEEPKASTKNKFRDLKENSSLEDQLYDILDDAFDQATSSQGYEADYTSKSDLIKFAIPKILALVN